MRGKTSLVFDAHPVPSRCFNEAPHLCGERRSRCNYLILNCSSASMRPRIYAGKDLAHRDGETGTAYWLQ